MKTVDGTLRKVFRALVDGRSRWPLYLHGAVGRGKSCAALALCDYVYDSLYVGCEELADKVMKDPEIDELWKRIRWANLVVLDEIGVRDRVTDLHYTVVKQFTDARDFAPAIYISNLLPSQIREVYDDRISSRMLCGTWCELKGDDRRMA